MGSRFDDSSEDDEDLVPPMRGVGRTYADTDSLPSPTLQKRRSFSQFFRRPTSGGSDGKGTEATVPVGVDVDGDVASGHRRTSSESILSKRTGKEKRFLGLRKLFRIKE